MRTVKETFLLFATQISRNNKIPSWLAFLLHFLANVQIFYLILEPTFDPELRMYLKALEIVRTISSWVVGFNIFKPPTSQPLLFLIWIVIMLYLLALLIFSGEMLKRLLYKKEKESQDLFSILGIVYTIHSKLLFCPIHYYLCWVISLHPDCGTLIDSSSNQLNCQLQYFVISALAMLVNFGFACAKEFFGFQIRGTRDNYTVKNNVYFQMMLLHKTAVVIFMTVVYRTRILTTVFNLVGTLGYCYNLVRTLPFYDTIILKNSYIFAAINLTFSFFTLVFTFKSGEEYYEALTILLSVMMIRFALGFLSIQLQRIFGLQFTNPNEALHILLLLENFTTKYSNVPKLDDDYQENSIKLYGLLKKLDVNAENLGSFATISQYHEQLYAVVLRKLTELSKQYPKSQNLTLLIIEIYVRKIGNAAKAITLMNILKKNSPSLQTRSAIKEIYTKLEHIYKKNHTDQELEALKYFKYRDDANALKEKFLLETTKHMRVWKELAGEKVDAKMIVREAEEIDALFKGSRKTWLSYVKTWEQNFSAPFLLYGVYLEVVRKDMHESLMIMKRYYDMRKDKRQVRKTINAFSSDFAIILASIEVDKPGVIMDASSSVHALFNIAKDSLVGQKIDAVLPRYIAKSHDSYIKRYTMHCRPDLNRLTHTFARTVDGHLFPVHIRLKIYPYIYNGLNVIAQIRKMNNPEVILVVDPKGAMVDCSEEVYGLLNLSMKDLDSLKIRDLCPQFQEIEEALQFLFEEARDLFVPNVDGVRSNLSDVGLESEESSEDKKDDSMVKTASQIQAIENEKKTLNFQSISKTFSPKNTLWDKNTLFGEVTEFSKVPSKNSFTSDQKFPTEMKNPLAATCVAPKKVAKEIYKRFKNGVNLQFSQKVAGGSLGKMEKSGRGMMNLDVKVEGTMLDGQLYKVIKFLNMTSTSLQKPMTKGTTTATQSFGTHFKIKTIETKLIESKMLESKVADTKLIEEEQKQLTKDAGDDFEEKFPTEFERTEPSFEKEPEVERKVIILKESNVMGLTRVDSRVENKTSTGKTLTPAMGMDQMDIKEFSKRRDPQQNNSSSLKTSSHREVRIVKALNDIFDKKTMRPITRIAVVVVYLAMLIVLSLVTLEYIFSDRSFDQMEAGVLIINIASYRLLDLVVSWEYILVIYAQAVGLQTPTDIEEARAGIWAATNDLINQNEALQNQLQSSGEGRLLLAFFDKQYELWVPHEPRTFTGGSVDTFIASQVISTNNLDISMSDGDPADLVGKENILFVLNNTANDIIAQSEIQIGNAEEIINSIIHTNESLVVLLLVLEVVALVFVLIALLLVVRVINRSYMQLFRVLTKVNHETITTRINELTLIKECFAKNIEAKEFSSKVEMYLEQDSRKAKQGVKAKSATNFSRHREDKFVLREITIESLRALIIAIVLLGIMAGSFFISYFTSASTFSSLQTVNDRLSITHRLGYTFDMVLGGFYYFVIFDNQNDFMFRYNAALEEFDDTLDFLANANQQLLTVLPDPKTGQIDPNLMDFLDTSVCSYLTFNETEDETLCNQVTAGGGLGLLGMNTQYYQRTRVFYESYLRDPIGIASPLVNEFTSSVTAIISTISTAYEYLRDYLVADFQSRIKDQQTKGLLLFVLVLIALGVSTLIIQLITINKFRKIDIGIRMVLKLVPLVAIQENRLLGFYLKNEFKKELEDIKQFV